MCVRFLPPICEQPRKCRSWIGLIWQRTVLFKFTDYQRFNYVIKNWDVGEKWQQILHVLVRFQIFVKFHVYSTSKSLEIEAEAANCSFFPLLVINFQKPFPQFVTSTWKTFIFDQIFFISYLIFECCGHEFDADHQMMIFTRNKK